jgi:hypothetical protein
MSFRSPATKQSPLKLRAPSVSPRRVPLDGNGGGDWPLLSAEQPRTHLALERADGSRGSIVGAYRVVRHLGTGSTTTVETVRELTGAHLAMAWDCGRLGG